MMIESSTQRTLTRADWLIMGSLALVSILAHVLTNGNYGIFRDELYYWDSTRHLAWGYVDHPPLSIAVLKMSVALFGDSVGALRIVPSLCGAALIILVGMMAVEFGANRFGVLLASLSALIVPVYIINTGFYSMNALDLVFWALLFYILIRILRTGNERLWVLWGLVLGLTVLNKLGVVALVVALIPALVIGGQARALASRYFWIGAGITAVIVSPFVTWQLLHGWPTLEFIHNATTHKIAGHSLWEYFTEQILPMGPILAPIWLIGLAALLLWRPLRRYRTLGIIWIGAFVFYGLQRSKPYYLSTAYAPLFAAGATLVGQWLSPWRVAIRVTASTLLIAILVAGAWFVAPLTLPILPPDELVVHMTRIGIAPSAEETNSTGALPQYLADRFGWKEMADDVAKYYLALPDSLRSQCVIVAHNYGEAGAMNYFGRKYGLPTTISQHNSHFLWGYGKTDGNVILTIDYSPDDLRTVYDSVTVLGTVGSGWAMPDEINLPVCLCTGLRVDWDDAWTRGKDYM